MRDALFGLIVGILIGVLAALYYVQQAQILQLNAALNQTTAELLKRTAPAGDVK